MNLLEISKHNRRFSVAVSTNEHDGLVQAHYHAQLHLVIDLSADLTDKQLGEILDY